MSLALSDEILLKVDRSARYIGGEINSVKKDPNEVKVRFCMAFPDCYEIGMSHLGIQILYDMFNRREDTWCERVYSPWPDLANIMKAESIPLFALESQEPIKTFDFLGITLQYEMCYTNILELLDLSNIPVFSKERTNEDPIVIGGGPCSYNPEPICDFFDMFFIGEGEITYDKLLELYKSHKYSGAYDRQEFLLDAAKIPGIYVPSLYEVDYNDDGTIKSFEPKVSDIPRIIDRQIVKDMDEVCYPSKPIIPFVQATQDRVVLEIMRGCIRGCRFCQAGYIYRPSRPKSVETLKKEALLMLESTGYDEISLSSLSTSDYPHLPEILDFIIEECKKRKVRVSLPSLRIDSFSLDTMSKISDIKKGSITFAPEAGSQRMRDRINKGISHDEIINGAKMAFEAGWNKVKLYFMLGLPSETDEDVIAIANLAQEIASLYYETVPKEKRQGKCQITVSTSFFVPKPFTPFQWEHMESQKEYIHRAGLLKDTIRKLPNQKSISYQYHAPDVTILEGVFALGDRRLNAAIYEAYKMGAHFDAWSEFFDNTIWDRAFEKCGIDTDFYTMRPKEYNEILPWDHIDIGVNRKFFEKESKKSKNDELTPNCRENCSGCGMAMRNTKSVCPS